MKIAIISDTHDNMANIKKALDYINDQKITELIHCGDVCAPITMVEIAEQFKGNINLCIGNVDGDPFRMLQRVQDGKAANVTIHQEVGEFAIDGKKIAINHYPKIGEALAKTGDYDLVFYGHDHKPWVKKIGKTQLVNPGNVANIINAPTFAIYDTKTDNLELVKLDEL